MTCVLKLETIKHNLEQFKELLPHQKLMIDDQFAVLVDNRYFQGLRRITDGLVYQLPSSREATYKVIKLTYESLKYYPEYSKHEFNLITQSLENLISQLSITYPDYKQLSELIYSIQNDLTNGDNVNDFELIAYSLKNRLDGFSGGSIDHVEISCNKSHETKNNACVDSKTEFLHIIDGNMRNNLPIISEKEIIAEKPNNNQMCTDLNKGNLECPIQFEIQHQQTSLEHNQNCNSIDLDNQEPPLMINLEEDHQHLNKMMNGMCIENCIDNKQQDYISINLGNQGSSIHIELEANNQSLIHPIDAISLPNNLDPYLTEITDCIEMHSENQSQTVLKVEPSDANICNQQSSELTNDISVDSVNQKQSLIEYDNGPCDANTIHIELNLNQQSISETTEDQKITEDQKMNKDQKTNECGIWQSENDDNIDISSIDLNDNEKTQEKDDQTGAFGCVSPIIMSLFSCMYKNNE